MSEDSSEVPHPPTREHALGEGRWRTRTSTRRIVLHDSHTAPDLGPSARDYLRAKGRELGLLDIGYHFVIERDGTVHSGRPHHTVGSHTPGNNHDSVGVCLAGGHEGLNDFTQGQRDSLMALLAYLLSEYPGARVLGDSEVRRGRKGPPCPAIPMEEVRADLSSWLYNREDRMTRTLPGPDTLSVQNRLILEYLQAGRGLTNLIAITNLGVGSLTSRVAELRKAGYEITGAWKEDHWGQRYREYTMEAA